MAGIDKTLTDKGYISPGLGDAVSSFGLVCVVNSSSNFRGTVYSTLCNRDECENVSLANTLHFTWEGLVYERA